MLVEIFRLMPTKLLQKKLFLLGLSDHQDFVFYFSMSSWFLCGQSTVIESGHCGHFIVKVGHFFKIFEGFMNWSKF